MAVGTNATSQTDPCGVLQFATALGDSAESEAYGFAALAVATGTDAAARGENGMGNIAINLAPSSFTLAKGSGNLAVNLFGRGVGNRTVALGTGNLAINILGNNKVQAGKYFPDLPAVLSVAFDLFGSGNTVTAGPGPLALAGSFGQNGATIIKAGPGFNINGLRVGGAAAVSPAKAAGAAAQRGDTASHSVASLRRSKRAVTKPAAAAARHANR